jgi:phosphatidylserine synthase
MVIPFIIVYSMIVKDIRDFAWARKPAYFLSALTRAAGATVTRKFNNAYAGFSTTVGILAVLLLGFILAFYYLGLYMQTN